MSCISRVPFLLMRTPKLSWFLRFASAVCILYLSPFREENARPLPNRPPPAWLCVFRNMSQLGQADRLLKTTRSILPVDTLSRFRQSRGFQLSAKTQEWQIDRVGFEPWSGATQMILVPF